MLDYILSELYKTDFYESPEVFSKIQSDIINTLSANKFSLSQTRHLFNSIISHFEREMPVTNHYK